MKSRVYRVYPFIAALFISLFIQACVPDLNVEFRTYIPHWETWDSRTPYESLPSPWFLSGFESATAVITDEASWSPPYSLKIAHGAAQTGIEEIQLPIARGFPKLTISHRIMCPDSGSAPSPAIYLATEETFDGPFHDATGAWIQGGTLYVESSGGILVSSATGLTDGQWHYLVFKVNLQAQTFSAMVDSIEAIPEAGFANTCADISRIRYRLNGPPDNASETILYIDNVSIYVE